MSNYLCLGDDVLNKKRILMVFIFVVATIAFYIVNTGVADPNSTLQGEASYPAPVRERLLTAKEALADAKWLIALIEETHPIFLDMPEFYNKLDDNYEIRKLELLEGADHPILVVDFMMLCNRYLATLKDGHSQIFPPSGGVAIPLSFYWHEGGLMINASEQFPEGATVLSIGGIEVEAIGMSIDTHLAYENESGRYYNRRNNAGSRLFHLDAGVEADEEVELEILYADDHIEFVTFEYSQGNVSSSPKPVSFEFTMLEDESIVLITANSCTRDDSWQAAQLFLTEALKNGVTDVIVDIRQNGGGDSSVWDPFAVILGIPPNKFSFGVIRRHSPLARATTLRNQNIQGNYFRLPPIRGKVDNFPYNLQVLVGERTFSSAMFLVGYVRDAEFGSLVGRVPRNTVSHFGYTAQFTLPTSHLNGSVSTHYWMRPDLSLDASDEPLLDIELPYGEDALERAVQEIQARRLAH